MLQDFPPAPKLEAGQGFAVSNAGRNLVSGQAKCMYYL